LENARDGNDLFQIDSPQPKKIKTGKGVSKDRTRPSRSSDVGGTSLNVEATESF